MSNDVPRETPDSPYRPPQFSTGFGDEWNRKLRPVMKLMIAGWLLFGIALVLPVDRGLYVYGYECLWLSLVSVPAFPEVWPCTLFNLTILTLPVMLVGRFVWLFRCYTLLFVCGSFYTLTWTVNEETQFYPAQVCWWLSFVLCSIACGLPLFRQQMAGDQTRNASASPLSSSR